MFQFTDHYGWEQITELVHELLFDWVHKNQNIVFAGGLVDPLSSYSFSIIKAMSVMCVSSGELGKINAVLSALESLFPLVAVQGYTSIWKVLSKVSCFSDQNSCNSCKSLRRIQKCRIWWEKQQISRNLHNLLSWNLFNCTQVETIWFPLSIPVGHSSTDVLFFYIHFHQ